MQGLEIGLTKMQAVVHNSLNVAVARNEMKAVYSCIWPPGTLGGCDPSAAVNGFFHLCDRQSASANGPAWAALKKHGSQESGFGKRKYRDRCETTNRSVLALVEGPEQTYMKVTRAFACISMNRPPCALGDCMAEEQQSWSSPDKGHPA